MFFKSLMIGILIIAFTGANDIELEALKETITIMTTQIYNLSLEHGTETRSLRKEMESLRKEVRAYPSESEQNNDKLTLKWAQINFDDIHRQLRDLQASSDIGYLIENQKSIEVKVKTIQRELKALYRTNDELLLEITRAKHDLKYNLDQARAAQEMCQHAGKNLKMSQMELAKATREFNEKQGNDSNDKKNIHYKGQIKTRHLKQVRQQIAGLQVSQSNIEEMEKHLEDKVTYLESKIVNLEIINNKLTENVYAIQKSEDEHENNSTYNSNNLNKMHNSVLELLEGVESLETKFNKFQPEVQREISKLEINYAQMNSTQVYLKEDQDNIRLSVRAVAFSVSNLMDKTQVDRKLLHNLNDSVGHLHEISSHHFFRLNDHILKSESITSELNSTMDEDFPEILSEVRALSSVDKTYQNLVRHLPHDCSAVSSTEGEFLLAPGTSAPIATFCKQGSTLLQRRFNGSIDFNRTFKEYAAGFGKPMGEFWIGNEALHKLTANNCSMLRVDMTDNYGRHWYAQYDVFIVASVEEGYKLQIGGFVGNASDAFDYQNHMEFSTVDRDRDISNSDCAGNYEGGWWFSHCQHVNLNGKYTVGLTWFDSRRNEWLAVATSTMTLRRRAECPLKI